MATKMKSSHGEPYSSNCGAQLKLMRVVSFFSGFHNKDVAFFHLASRTLIEADLIFNLPCIEQYSNSKSSGSLLSLSKYFNPHTYLHRQFVWWMGKDKRYFACFPLSRPLADVIRPTVR